MKSKNFETIWAKICAEVHHPAHPTTVMQAYKIAGLYAKYTKANTYLEAYLMGLARNHVVDKDKRTLKHRFRLLHNIAAADFYN